jgi:hypothetical protein
MATTRKKGAGRPASGKAATVRASVSLSSDTYKMLTAIARHKKVSTAWIMREAAEKYIADQWPLFDERGQGA